MIRRSHIINKQIFEIDFSVKEKSHELQNKISALFNRQIHPQMEELFDRVIPADKLIRIDNLQIDIGHIRMDQLESDLVRKVIDRLEEELLLILLHDNSPSDGIPADVINDEKGSYIELLKYFLLRGSLPWWAGSDNSTDPMHALEFLLTHAPDDLRALIMETGQRSYVRKRLVNQFSEEQIRSLISILEPAEAEFIFDYHTHVVQVRRQEQTVPGEESDFKEKVWELILSFLLVERGTHFNRREFVKSTLSGMAAYYNISFSGLLSIFVKAVVPGSPALRTVDSLQAIIMEIVGETAGAPAQLSGPADKTAAGEIESTQQDIDLLRYYLLFGSLPWWAPPMDPGRPAWLFSELLKKYPATMATLIKNVGQAEYSRKLIVRSFDDDLLSDVLKVIEPDNAEFISDYIAGIKSAHTRKPVFKAQSDELHRAIWEFVLEYLLVDRGSEFNRQIFLDSNVKRLASHFNLEYHKVLLMLIQQIAVAHSDSVRHVSLFQGLSALYKSSSGTNVRNESRPAIAAQEIGEHEEEIRKVNIKDILYFWIRSGFLPWWAGDHSAWSPVELLMQLNTQSEEEALNFLKYAGLDGRRRKRLVGQIPFRDLLEIFRLLPQGEKAVKITGDLLILSQTNLKDRLSENSYHRVLLLILWSNYIESSYKSFEPGSFVRIALNNLAILLDISPGDLLESLNIEDHAQLLQEYRAGQVQVPQDIDTMSDDFRIEDLLAVRLRGERSSNDLLDEALAVFSYYLKNQKLPADFRRDLSITEVSIIRKLVLYLFRKSPASLKRVLASGESLLALIELFETPASADERAIRSLLRSDLENNIETYLRRHGSLSANQSWTMLIDAYLEGHEPGRNMEFVGKLLKYSAVSAHLAYLYDHDTAYRLIGAKPVEIGWGNETISFLRSFYELFNVHISDRIERERFSLLFRTFNFMLAGGAIKIGSWKEYLRYFFKFIYEREYQLTLKLGRVLQKVQAAESGRTHAAYFLNDIGEELKPYSKTEETGREVSRFLKESEAKAQRNLVKNIEEQLTMEKDVLYQEQSDEERGRKKDEQEADLYAGEPVYIRNAGLVLLHPFLPTYFNRLQMLEKGDFISDELRQRAVHLLQYLAYGTENNEEQDLVLNKILCNIPVEEPVLREISLTEHEKAVSAELLNAVIAQWEKLKNTTAESLQASFLQREGVLSRIDDNWNLKVEQRGYDVLLQTLPWGLGMVRTSWMSEFIYVEWM